MFEFRFGFTSTGPGRLQYGSAEQEIFAANQLLSFVAKLTDDRSYDLSAPLGTHSFLSVQDARLFFVEGMEGTPKDAHLCFYLSDFNRSPYRADAYIPVTTSFFQACSQVNCVQAVLGCTAPWQEMFSKKSKDRSGKDCVMTCTSDFLVTFPNEAE